ncbi:MAG: menaquinol oxidoreductase [Acidimicrobiia bacterium]|nr:menaquinol oxidoreductase [Acidimicrobiia bacterium]
MSESDPRLTQGKRLLGVVPGQPPGGERKVPQEQDLVMVSPHLLVRHAVVALAVLLLVLIVSILFDAPLREVANPFETPNPEKAPWYFAALQELLAHFHPMVAGVLVPAAIIGGLVALPYVDRSAAVGLGLRKVAVVAFTMFLLVWIVLTLIGFAFRGPNWSWVWPWDEWHGEL